MCLATEYLERLSWKLPRGTDCERGGQTYWFMLWFSAFEDPTMAQRVTLRTRKSYNTKSNLRRIVKTPGGKLVYHHLKKRGTAPKCGDCGLALPGVGFVHMRPRWWGWYTCVIRFPLFAPAHTHPSPNVRRLCRGLMVVQDVATVWSHGTLWFSRSFQGCIWICVEAFSELSSLRKPRSWKRSSSSKQPLRESSWFRNH